MKMTITATPRVSLDDLRKVDALYPELSAALLAVAEQMVNSTRSATLDQYLTPASGLTKRAAAGEGSSKRKVKIVTVEVADGETSYERPNGELYFTRNWGVHKDVQVLREAREADLFILLYGSPGCGKTALVEAAFGSDLETVLGSGDTEVSDLVGGYVQTPSGGFEWVDGALLRAAEMGKPLLIDEVGLIDPKVMSIVYGLMDGRREYVVTANPERGTVKAKQGFYVIAATNPNAPGVRLSEALLSRFSIHAEMTTDYTLAKKLGVSNNAITCATNLARKQQSGEVMWSPQMRELLAFRDLEAKFGTAFAISNLLAAAPEMDRPTVADVFTRVYAEDCRPAKI
jgi:hypothetical protein